MSTDLQNVCVHLVFGFLVFGLLCRHTASKSITTEMHTSGFHTCQQICRMCVQPIPLGVTFSKAQTSKLERRFCHVSEKRDVRALSFELWNSIPKCNPKWDRLYMPTDLQEGSPLYVCVIYTCTYTYAHVHTHTQTCERLMYYMSLEDTCNPYNTCNTCHTWATCWC